MGVPGFVAFQAYPSFADVGAFPILPTFTTSIAFLPRHVGSRSADMVDVFAFAHHSAISGDAAQTELMFILYPIASNLSPDAKKDINKALVAPAGMHYCD